MSARVTASALMAYPTVTMTLGVHQAQTAGTPPGSMDSDRDVKPGTSTFALIPDRVDSQLPATSRTSTYPTTNQVARSEGRVEDRVTESLDLRKAGMAPCWSRS